MMIMVASILKMIIGENAQTARSAQLAAALNVAEAGVEAAIWELNYNLGASQWTGWGGTDPKTKMAFLKKPNGSIVGEYSISVANPATATAIISVTGYIPNHTSPKSTRKTRVVVKKLSGGTFPMGVFGNDYVDFNSACTDSYDSRLGRYNVNGNIGLNGDIGTNATVHDSVYVRSGSTVKGDIFVGPGSNPNVAIKIVSGALVSGQKAASSAPTPFPAITEPAGLSSKPNISLLSSQTATITGSGYYSRINLGTNAVVTITNDATIFVNDWTMNSGTRINILNNARVKIYVGHSMEIGTGAILNEYGDPSRLSVFATDSFTGVATSGILIRSDVQLYGTISANRTSIDVGTGADIFGGIKAKNILMRSSSCVHYDDALSPGSGGGGANFYNVYSWQEK
jgi:cytoskeletal protein CcmA (bactofilin family)